MANKSYYVVNLVSPPAVGGETTITLTGNVPLIQNGMTGICLTGIYPGAHRVVRGTGFLQIDLVQIRLVLQPGQANINQGEMANAAFQMFFNPINQMSYEIRRPFTLSLTGYFFTPLVAGDQVIMDAMLEYETIPVFKTNYS